MLHWRLTVPIYAVLGDTVTLYTPAHALSSTKSVNFGIQRRSIFFA